MLEQHLDGPISRIQESKTASVKPIRPLIYNFFVSERPDDQEQTIEKPRTPTYRSFYSQEVGGGKTQYFKPTINFKKITEEPKFLLSVERKKIRNINGINQKATSEKPSRNSYRGFKVRTNTLKTANQEDTEPAESPPPRQAQHHSHIQSSSARSSPGRPRAPHLHFNLQHLLAKRRTFTREYSRAQNIQGSNFPYYHYFTSEKSGMGANPAMIRQKRVRQKVKAQFNTERLRNTAGVDADK